MSSRCDSRLMIQCEIVSVCSARMSEVTIIKLTVVPKPFFYQPPEHFTDLTVGSIAFHPHVYEPVRLRNCSTPKVVTAGMASRHRA